MHSAALCAAQAALYACPRHRRVNHSTMLVAAARHATLLQPARRRLAVQAVNLDAWLEEHGPSLKPPVANKLLFEGDLKVMVVGGPNQRRDYHLQEGE